jgi:hypothetical protein
MQVFYGTVFEPFFKTTLFTPKLYFMKNRQIAEDAPKTIIKPAILFILYICFTQMSLLDNSKLRDWVNEKRDKGVVDTSIQKEDRERRYIKVMEGGFGFSDTILYRHTLQKDSIGKDGKTFSTLIFIDSKQKDTVLTTLAQTKISRVLDNGNLSAAKTALNKNDSTICENLKQQVADILKKDRRIIVTAVHNAIIIEKCSLFLNLKLALYLFIILLIYGTFLTNTKPTWTFRGMPLAKWFYFTFLALIVLRSFLPFIEPNTKIDFDSTEYLNVNIDTNLL